MLIAAVNVADVLIDCDCTRAIRIATEEQGQKWCQWIGVCPGRADELCAAESRHSRCSVSGMANIYDRAMAVPKDAITQDAEVQVGVRTNEGGCRFSFVNRDQNVYVEELNESECELRLLTGDDRVEFAAPQTAAKFRRRAERADAWVVNHPSDAEGSVIEPDARRVGHASGFSGFARYFSPIHWTVYSRLRAVVAPASSASAADGALPRDVAQFIERRDLCEHSRGESLEGDTQRRAFVARRLRQYCVGSDAALARLRKKYADDADTCPIPGEPRRAPRRVHIPMAEASRGGGDHFPVPRPALLPSGPVRGRPGASASAPLARPG